jgi:4'-phosphopantetheinyl transferase
VIHSWSVFPLSGNSRLPDEGILHLWLVCLPDEPGNAQAEQESVLQSCLTAGERGRAERYQSQAVRQQFVITRGLLRILLGQYLQHDPKKIAFGYSAHGKPELSMPQSKLHFNISHSKGMVVFAVRTNQPVGVDLEWINPAANCGAITRRMFSAQEQAEINDLPPLEQPAKFFQIWTRKEALIKLFGDRLFSGLKTYEASAQSSSYGRWVTVGDQSVWLQDLQLMECFAGAIATPTPPDEVQHHRWHWSSASPKIP